LASWLCAAYRPSANGRRFRFRALPYHPRSTSLRVVLLERAIRSCATSGSGTVGSTNITLHRRHHLPGHQELRAGAHFKELTEAGFDLGGSGPDADASCCVGPSRANGPATNDSLLRRDHGRIRRDAPSAVPVQFKVKAPVVQRLCGLHRARGLPSSHLEGGHRQDDAAVAITPRRA